MSAIHKHVVITGIGVSIVVIRDQQEVELYMSAGSSCFLCWFVGVPKTAIFKCAQKNGNTFTVS